MSMGYIPKKRLYVKRQRKLREKYKNFSCITCERAYALIMCCHRSKFEPPFDNIYRNVRKCKYWKAMKKEKVIPDKPKKTNKIKNVLNKIF